MPISSKMGNANRHATRWLPAILMAVGAAFVLATWIPGNADEPFEPTDVEEIIGGSTTQPGAWPSQTLVYDAVQGVLCGGTLIHPEWVLTAAHCVESGDVQTPAAFYDLYIGAYDINDLSDSEYRTAAQVVVHPGYTDALGFDWDVALLRLTTPSTRPVAAIAGTTAFNTPGVTGTAVGWGTTIAYPPGQPNPGNSTDILREVSIPIVDDANCAAAYGNEWHAPSMLCAGPFTGFAGTCQGDSGGPLYVQGQEDNWVVVGITSWGYGCGWPGAPDVYTRVTAIASWIQTVSGVVPGSYTPATPTSVPTRDPNLHYVSVSGAISHELVVAPTPTATKPTGIYLQKATFYTTPGGLLYVVGELVNGLNHTVEFVQITSTFYNHNGGVIASRIGLPEITTIPAGGDSPFAVIYFGDLSQVAGFTLQVTRYSATPIFPVVTGLEANVTETTVDFLGNIHVKGTITNTGNKTWKLVQPLAAFYEPSGLVVRVKSTITFPAALAPGQTGVFDIFTDDPGNIDSFRIWIDGSQ